MIPGQPVAFQQSQRAPILLHSVALSRDGIHLCAMANVSIVGGGLAGLNAAWRLAERGCSVRLYEARTTLGGKTGAVLHDGHLEEHGYHLFPQCTSTS